MPKISICSSSYNHEKYVIESIESVLAQTVPDFELIITDDFSTDRNVEKIRQVKDPRITLICHEKNRGNMVASDTCYQRTSGQYITWLTTDDVWEPHMLEVLSGYLDDHPEVLGVFGQPSFIDDDGRFLDHEYGAEGLGLNRFQHLRNLFGLNNYFCCPTAMIRRSAFDKVGYFQRQLRQIHDLAHWILLLFEGELAIIPDKVLRFRLRANNANAGSDTPENWRRINFEVHSTLHEYAKRIVSAELLLKIFPEVKAHPWPLEDKLVHFHLAQVALSQSSAVHRLFGLELLYQLMSKREMADYLLARCSFDYPDLFELEAQKAVFADYSELGKSEADLQQEIKLLQQMLADGRAHRQQLEDAHQQVVNSASWKMLSVLRRARSVLPK